MNTLQLNARTIAKRFPNERERADYMHEMEIIELFTLDFDARPEIALALASNILDSNFGRDFVMAHEDGTVMDRNGVIMAVNPHHEDGIVFNPYVRGPMKRGMSDNMKGHLIRNDLWLDDGTFPFSFENPGEESEDLIALSLKDDGKYIVQRFFRGIDRWGFNRPEYVYEVGSHHYDIHRPNYALTVTDKTRYYLHPYPKPAV